TARTYSGNGTASPYNVVRFLFDWYRVTYSRALIARSEELRLRTDQGTAGNNLIRVRDFGGSDLLLFDVTDPEAPARVGVAPAQIVAAGGGRFDLRFDHDNAGGNGEYVALRDGTIPEIPSSDIALRSTPSLLGGGAGAVYVALAHDSLLEGARDLANWRAERFSSLAVAESEVWDVFHNGRRDPEAIKAFAAYGLHRWATPIEFLCLVGDANEDHRNLGTVAMPDLVPSHSLWAAYEGAPEESDQYYAELTRDSEGRWDDLSDIYVGRLAVNDLDELAWNLQRMQAYEAGTGTSQQWRRRVLFLADDALSGSLGGGFGDGYGWKGPSELEFENVSRFMADSLLADHPEEELDPVVFAISDWTHPCDTACDSLPDGQCGIWCECRNPQWELEYSCTRDTVLVRVLPVLRERLNEGGLVWNYQGHANKFFLGHEEFYRDDNIGRRDVEALRNEGKPFVFLGFACHLAEFDRYDELTREDCMAEKLMNVHQSAVEEPAGAVASFASSGYEFLTPNLGFNVHVMNAFFYPERSLDPNELDGGGVGLPSSGGPGYAWTLGESTTRARLMYQADNPGSAGNTTNNRQAAQRYVLLGDPALRPDVAKPEITVTIAGEPVQNPGLPFFVNGSSYPNGAEIRFEAADSRGLTMRLVDSIQGEVPASEYTLTTIDETTDGVVQRQRLDYLATFRSEE
ncbi:MAG: hypothetical protein KC591_12015, partial [Gemmatimonadetes bacterium]|nr:hypothetical protein [Gemmatimonadota bacterium]